MGRTGHSGESRDVLCFLMQHSLLFAISNGKIKNKGPKEQIMPLIQAGPTDCGCPIKEVALTHEK